MSDRKKNFDLIRRGEKKPTLSGTLTFIGLRMADIPLQHALLSHSHSSTAPASSLGVRILSSLGLRTIFTHTSISLPSSLLLPIGTLTSPSASPTPAWISLGWMTPLANLTPTSLLLLLMSAGSAAKQIYWHLALSQDSFPASAAVAVSIYNTLVNSTNTLLFLALGTTSLLSRPLISFPSSSSSSPSCFSLPLSTVVGTLLYVVGMGIETVSERQRAQFKSRSENKGKVCKEGLWNWARHINYFGYALWRGGYCMVGCGWVGGILMGLWQSWDLSHRAVAVQDEYCSARYGEQWVRFKQEVPCRIIPGIY
ncbi:hypothetical protein E0Z10_g10914 [Xylaria hypoxylon]|uniref:Steroid 5-alpha reductase C-terminal domain-containing protein n=1 Tax=Xylaria hypoxylon TaxID=37992 RepID=A0A4Z0XX98_9PEZI|nr:hypothetical protein E0Z10_g10914 [Xylaria hypoxylon]